jgi:hypothetical protein
VSQGTFRWPHGGCLHASAIALDLCAPVLFMSLCENDAVVMVDTTQAMETLRRPGWATRQRVFVPDDSVA